MLLPLDPLGFGSKEVQLAPELGLHFFVLPGQISQLLSCSCAKWQMVLRSGEQGIRNHSLLH